MNPSPEFLAALTAFNGLTERGQCETPEARRAWDRLIRLAPAWFLDELGAKMRELDLLPDPAGFDADGRPVYAAEAVASRLGLPAAEVAAEANGELVARVH